MATELSRHAGYEGQLQVERVSSVVEREFNLQLWEHVYVPPNWKAARSLWRPHSSCHDQFPRPLRGRGRPARDAIRINKTMKLEAL